MKMVMKTRDTRIGKLVFEKGSQEAVFDSSWKLNDIEVMK